MGRTLSRTRVGAFSAAAKAGGATSSGDGGLAPGSPAGAGREGRSGAVPGLARAPPRVPRRPPRRRRGEKDHAHLLLLQFIGHLGPSGPCPAPAAPLRLRLCSAALGPLGVSSPPPARCARVERCLCSNWPELLQTCLTTRRRLLRLVAGSKRLLFFSHWKGRVQTARVRLPELAKVGGPALKGVELSVRGGGQGKPGLCTECRTSASGVRWIRPFFAARSALKWLSLFPHCDSAQSELKERSPKMKGTFLHQGNVTLIAYAKLERAPRSPRGPVS